MEVHCMYCKADKKTCKNGCCCLGTKVPIKSVGKWTDLE